MTRLTLPAQAPLPELIRLERALIGACVVDTRGCRVWPTLAPETFSLGKHEAIWGALLDLTERTDHPTLVDLAYELQRRGDLERVGGPAALAEMVDEGCCLVDLAHAGYRVRQGHLERVRAALGTELAAHPEGSEVLAALLRSLEEGGTPEPARVGQVWAEAQAAGVRRPIPLGLPPLDQVTGLLPGQLVIIGGRTSHGKTAFAAQLARRVAAQDIAVEYVTLEESRRDLVARLLASATGQSSWDVLFGGGAAPEAVETLDALPLVVTAPRGAGEDLVCATVAASRATVVLVDHIQQITTRGDETRAYALERVCGRLAGIARRDDKVVIVTAQLNRQMEARQGAPTLGDLRDSGGLEQAGRVILLVYWPAKHDPKADPAAYVVVVAKNNLGPTQSVALRWEARSGRFFVTPGEAG